MQTDPHETEEYQEYIDECLKFCDCCPLCSDVPCGGAMAGGMCDNARCRCDDDLIEDLCEEDEDWP